jgi:Sulfotransferase domain
LLLGCFGLTNLMTAVQGTQKRRTENLVDTQVATLQEHVEPDSTTSFNATDYILEPQPRPASRGKQRRPRPKRQNNDNVSDPPPKLKVPLPIFVPSLPKSGTTSIHKYFQCGNQRSAHLVYRIDGKVHNKIGRCWQRNIQQGKPPLEGCGDHDIWSDTGYVDLNYRKGQNKSQSVSNIPCYYPLIQALDQIYEAYPNSTFLFVTRNETNWLESIQTYHEGFIVDVWKRCKIDGFPGLDARPEDFLDFYRWHQRLIRSFAEGHPSITYLEVPLEAANTAEILEDKIGISNTCWGHHNQQQSTPSIQ